MPDRCFELDPFLTFPQGTSSLQSQHKNPLLMVQEAKTNLRKQLDVVILASGNDEGPLVAGRRKQAVSDRLTALGVEHSTGVRRKGRVAQPDHVNVGMAIYIRPYSTHGR